MIGIANIRKVKGLDDINEVYGIKEKKAQDEKDPADKPAKPKKEQKPIPKKTKKQKVIDRELKKLVPIFLAKNPLCQIQSHVCTQTATCAHHVNGRGKVDVLNPKKMKASCSACNGWVEANDKKARNLGHKKSKF